MLFIQCPILDHLLKMCDLQALKMKFIISHLRDEKTKLNSALLLSFLTKLISNIGY